MVEVGKLKAGDKALEYGLLAEAERGQSDRGLKEALEDAGLKVDYIEISPEVNQDASLAVPILTSYLASNPDVKAIGTQHGNVTSFIPKALEDAGKQPGEVTVGGIDLVPATIDGLQDWLDHRGARSAALPAGLFAGDPVRAVEEVRLTGSTSTPAPASSRRRPSTSWCR